MGKESGFTQQYPRIDTAPLPVEPYISAETFELEKERVFKRSWLSVGRRYRWKARVEAARALSVNFITGATGSTAA